jgi:hypothetical protein
MNSENQVSKAAATIVEHQHILNALSPVEGQWLIDNPAIALPLLIHSIRNFKYLRNKGVFMGERALVEVAATIPMMHKVLENIYPNLIFEKEEGKIKWPTCLFHDNARQCGPNEGSMVFSDTHWVSDCRQIHPSHREGTAIDFVAKVFGINVSYANYYIEYMFPNWLKG